MSGAGAPDHEIGGRWSEVYGEVQTGSFSVDDLHFRRRPGAGPLAVRRLVPYLDHVLARRPAGDDEPAGLVGDAVVRMIEDVDPRVHPGVAGVALELHQAGLAHRDGQLLALDRHR